MTLNTAQTVLQFIFTIVFLLCADLWVVVILLKSLIILEHVV